MKIRQRHSSFFKDKKKTVNAPEKQQSWQLSFTEKLGLGKIGNNFITKNDERYNQLGGFTEVDFIWILAYFFAIVRIMYKRERNI